MSAPATEQGQLHQAACGLVQLPSQYLEGWRCHGHWSGGPLGPGPAFDHPYDDYLPLDI